MAITSFVLISIFVALGVLVGVGRLISMKRRERQHDVAIDEHERAPAQDDIGNAADCYDEWPDGGVLREVQARQLKDEPLRRWFSNNEFDLIVWFDRHGAISEFQLCYDRSDVERALTWSPTHGYRHWIVATGDATGMDHAMTPILKPNDTGFPKQRVLAAFVESADALDPTIRGFIIHRLQGIAL